MESFYDLNGHLVHLAFGANPFNMEPKHVFVICRYQDQWLLTRHKTRGLEFPGGKIETGETPFEAAIREVFEETGAIVDKLIPIGYYKVSDPNGPFVKKVFYAIIKGFSEQQHYFETNGPKLIEYSTLFKHLDDQFSFMMRDQVLKNCLYYMIKNGLIEERNL